MVCLTQILIVEEIWAVQNFIKQVSPTVTQNHSVKRCIMFTNCNEIGENTTN